MAKEKIYYQCGLAQNNSRTVGYIEERGAKVGAMVQIDELGGFWEVIGVSKDHPMTQHELSDKQTMDRNSFLSVKPRR